MRVGRTTEALPQDATGSLPPSSLEPSSKLDGAPAAGAEHGAASSGSHTFWGLLRAFGHELDRGENLAEKAINGPGGHASLSPERLIALQAGIYRYSEAVDLVTKLVDRGTQAVRTTLQNQ
jgi:hypothetical protein